MRQRRILALAATLALAACQLETPEPERTGTHSRPLIGGTVDTEDPAVVALTRGGTSSFCTGTLVSPRVVLTAAHCIDMAGADPDITVFFGTDTTGEGTRIGVAKKTQHPQWSGSVGAFDIGMMLLSFPQDPLMALPMNAAPATEHVGAEYRHVGFGVYDRETMDADGKKRTGTTTISSVSGDIIRSGDDMVNVCFGDSGGPAFLVVDGVEAVAGVHSFTSSEQCLPPSGDTAVDQYVANYVLPWIQDNDPSCLEDGLCAPIGCIDDPDCEPCGPDGTCTQDCPLPDPDCPTSGLGDICQADTQCSEGFCVSWFPDRDFQFCTIECTPGGSQCPGGMSCQDVNPHGNICYFDEEPPGVVGDGCDDHTDCGSYICEAGACVTRCDIAKGILCLDGFACTDSGNGVDYYCLAEGSEEGGCAVGGSRGGLLLALLALVSLGRRRRGRRGRSSEIQIPVDNLGASGRTLG